MIFDAHLDLSMNALEWNRDLTWPLENIRSREAGLSDKPDRGLGTVCFPEMRKANIGICVATQIGRYVAPGSGLPGWHSQAQAWAQTQGQLAWYKAMEDARELTQIVDIEGLRRNMALWHYGENHPKAAPHEENSIRPIGYILSLEGADSLIDLSYLEKSFHAGLKAIGPAHYGPGVYAHGTNANQKLNVKGRELLVEMERLGIILDATHLCDLAFWDAMEIFRGPVWASHSLARKFNPHNRQFSDEQLSELISRKAVIGMAFDAWMMTPGWVRGQSTPQNTQLSLDRIFEHIDHICQLAGNAAHVGIGSDLDGGFGTEQTPKDLQTIADLINIKDILQRNGYSQADIDQVMWKNWVDFLERAWA